MTKHYVSFSQAYTRTPFTFSFDSADSLSSFTHNSSRSITCLIPFACCSRLLTTALAFFKFQSSCRRRRNGSVLFLCLAGLGVLMSPCSDGTRNSCCQGCPISMATTSFIGMYGEGFSTDMWEAKCNQTRLSVGKIPKCSLVSCP